MWQCDKDEPHKIIIKVYKSWESMRNAYVRDSRMFDTLGVLRIDRTQERALVLDSGTIRYYCADTLDQMRGFAIDMAIIEESFEGVVEWKNECLGPALEVRKGKVY